MTDSFLAPYVKTCFVSTVINVDNLRAVCKTALPWTTASGAIVLAMNREYLRMAIENPQVEAIILPDTLFPLPQNMEPGSKAIVVAGKPEELFYLLHLDKPYKLHGLSDAFVERHVAASAHIHPSAIVDDAVYIGENVYIGPFSVIERNTVIKDDSWVGPQCLIGGGAFFPRMMFGKKVHIPQQGGVKIGKGCRLHGQNVVTASSYYNEFTEIGDEVYLGFQTSVGHDAKLGNNINISSKALVAGRVQIGPDVWIGAGAVISNSLEIGRGASVKIGSVVIGNVGENEEVSGNFAINHRKNLLHKLRSEK